jgi:hypothetical protein
MITNSASTSIATSAAVRGSVSPDDTSVFNDPTSQLSGSITKTPNQANEREIATSNLLREHPRYRRLFALVDEERLRKILTHMLNETQFFSPYGIRSYYGLHLKLTSVYPRNICMNQMASPSYITSTVKNSELNIGLQIRKAVCSGATVTGADQFGLVWISIIINLSGQLSSSGKSRTFLDVLSQRVSN